jgi:zinc transporter 1/2/3
MVETFEGLGIGSRLAYLRLPHQYNWVPIAAAVLFGLTTPVGIAAGLGIRNTYNPGSSTASIVSGVLDSLSAGILIYTGLVEVCFFDNFDYYHTLFSYLHTANCLVAGTRIFVK